MAAGLGFKDFVTGEVLTAADVDGYLMQGVWVFASAAARDAAVTSPQEGNFAYLKDTNVTTYYTGSAWANLDTTGMTNPMTTTGDIIYSSPGSTPVRLGIGTANQVLTVNSGATAPEWKTPSAGGGGKVLQVVTATNSAAVQIATTTSTDTGITATITPTLATSKILIFITGNYELYRNSTANDINARIMRDATAILTYGSGGFSGIHAASTSSEIVLYNTASLHYLDSPATTSATTYKLQASVATTANAMAANWQFGGPGVITLLEIGA